MAIGLEAGLRIGVADQSVAKESISTKPFDGIFVLGGNIRMVNGQWHSTPWTQGTEKSVGGFSRVLASYLLYKEGVTDQIIFVTGKTVPLAQDPLHADPNVPTEASVAKDELLTMLANTGSSSDQLQTNVLEKTVTTLGNGQEIAEFVKEKGLRSIAILTSDWHVDRSEEFLNAQGLEQAECSVEFIASEAVIARHHLTASYKELAIAWYGSPAMQRRIEMELKGIADFRAGKYTSQPPH